MLSRYPNSVVEASVNRAPAGSLRSVIRILRDFLQFRLMAGLLAGLALQLTSQAVVPNLKVTLAWDQNTEADLAGYRLYYGLSSGLYLRTLEVTNGTKVSLSLPLPGRTYYFAVTAFDQDGHESDFSSEVSYLAPDGDIPAISVPRTASGPEDAPIPLDFGTPDPTGSTQWLLTQAPIHGKVESRTNGVFYVPHLDFFGTDSFEIVTGLETLSLVKLAWTVEVTPVNDPPSAFEIWGVPSDGSPSTIELLGWDADNDPLTYEIVTPPNSGTLSGIPPKVVYTPKRGFQGEDIFSFRVSDGRLTSAIAQVELVVDRSEEIVLAEDQFLSTPEDQELAFHLNVADVAGVGVRIVQGPESGTLAGEPPDLAYKPNPDFSGTDSFIFEAFDSTGRTDVAVVYINVEPENDPPTAVPLHLKTAVGIPTALVLSGTDPDEDALEFEIVDVPALGRLTGDPPHVTYHPNPGAVGTDTFSYRANDGTTSSPAALVSVDIVDTTPERPVVAASAAADGSLTLRWNTTPGRRYQIVFRTDVSGNWVPVSGELDSASGSLTWSAQVDGSGVAGFYAVRVLSP